MASVLYRLIGGDRRPDSGLTILGLNLMTILMLWLDLLAVSILTILAILYSALLLVPSGAFYAVLLAIFILDMISFFFN